MKTTSAMMSAAIASIIVCSPTAVSIANAAELKFFCAGALMPVMRELVPQFEKTSGHKVTIVYSNVNALSERVEKGEAGDVVITAPARLEALSKAGRVISTSQARIASVGAGIAVRKGVPKLDLGSVDGLKRALLTAKSVSFGDPGAGSPTGIHITKVMDQLGIADEMKPKLRLIRDVPTFVTLFNDLRSGKTDLGIDQISLIVEAPDIEFAGPLPKEVQVYTQFAAGVLGTSTEAAAAAALIHFISTRAAKEIFKSKGFDVP